MKNVCLNIVIQTPRSLANVERINAFCTALRSINPDFIPNKYGDAEPLKLDFVLDKAEELLHILNRQSGGTMIFSFSRPLNGLMVYSAAKGPRVPSNGIRVRFDYNTLSSRLEDLKMFIILMFESLNAAYACATLSGGSPYVIHVDDPKKNWGEINGVEIPPWNPSGIQCLPGIGWINIFGAEYVDFLGKDVLSVLPGYEVRPMNDIDSILLQPTERPEEMFAESGCALVDTIKRQIAKPRAFSGYDPGTPSFLAIYDAPAFDFSEIRP